MAGYEVEDEKGGRAWWDGKKLTPLDANGMPYKPGTAPGITNAEAKHLNDLRVAAQNIKSARAQAEEFGKLNRKHRTGGLMAIPGVSEALAAFKPEIATMQGLSNAMIPGMHITPGPMTDADAKLYKSAIPNPNLPGDANKAIRHDIIRKERTATARTYFFEKYAQTHGTLNGAEAAFNSWWDKYRADLKAKAEAELRARGARSDAGRPGQKAAYSIVGVR